MEQVCPELNLYSESMNYQELSLIRTNTVVEIKFMQTSPRAGYQESGLETSENNFLQMRHKLPLYSLPAIITYNCIDIYMIKRVVF